jgi:ribonuclease HII
MASILAKVSRDRILDTTALKYPEYNFEKHKGY